MNKKPKRPRIISGSIRNMKMEVPTTGTRPMTDRAKSAVFSMLHNFVIEAEILDLFAGSGALGIECLSRGALNSTFVDNSDKAVECINNNLYKSGFTSLGTVIQKDAKEFLQEYDKQKFKIIFVTPPYKLFNEFFIRKAAKLLKSRGVIIAEYPKGESISKEIGNLIKFDDRVYGITGIAYFKIKSN